MNVGSTLFRALQAYFWILVAASVLTLVWIANRFLLSEDVIATGWFAIAGFGALIVAFLLVVRRAAS